VLGVGAIVPVCEAAVALIDAGVALSEAADGEAEELCEVGGTVIVGVGAVDAACT